jgi:hypothetical protein
VAGFHQSGEVLGERPVHAAGDLLSLHVERVRIAGGEHRIGLALRSRRCRRAQVDERAVQPQRLELPIRRRRKPDALGVGRGQREERSRSSKQTGPGVHPNLLREAGAKPATIYRSA